MKAMLKQWPQAVIADDGDLRVLHDMANAGATMWGKPLPWPDYLWLDLEMDQPEFASKAAVRETYNIADPTNRGSYAGFSAARKSLDKTMLPSTGQFPLRNQVICMLELKVIRGDLLPKLARYKPGMPWPDFVRLKLDQWFCRKVEEAGEQIAGAKRLLPFQDARSIALIVNEQSPNLPTKIVTAYLTRAIHSVPTLDAVVYLSDGDTGEKSASLIVKNFDDPWLNRFSVQLMMMINGFDWSGDVPALRSGPAPEIVARIEMDERSRAMYRSWATGWRVASDPTPIPRVSMAISFVRREEFKSGLPPTQVDRSLVDCAFRWDPDCKNLRIDNPSI